MRVREGGGLEKGEGQRRGRVREGGGLEKGEG